MATNPIQRKSRNSFLLGILVSVLVMGIIVAILMMQLIKMKNEEDARIDSLKKVYVVSVDVKSGDNLANVSLKTVDIDASAVPSNAITSSSITENTIAKIDIKQGTIVTASMVQESDDATTDSLRVQEYNMIKLSSQLTTDDYIDIRLRMPSGTDYIVASKKKVEVPLIDGVDSENTIWLKMTEDETLLMSNAIIEAYISKGAVLYTTSYVEPGMQAQATPTYVPSNTVINLINNDPNITNTAKTELANRVNNGARESINNELSAYSDTRLDNIESGVSSEIQAAQEQRKSYLDALAGY